MLMLTYCEAVHILMNVYVMAGDLLQMHFFLQSLEAFKETENLS